MFPFRNLFIFLFIASFSFQKSIAQEDKLYLIPPGDNVNGVQDVFLDCNTPRILSSCNYLVNNTFSLSPRYDPLLNYADPFNTLDPLNPPLSLVPEWKASHGTPQAYDGVNSWSNSLPFPGAGYARFGSFNNFPNVGTGGEGIIQKISALQAGNRYLLSFFRKDDSFVPPGYASDQLKIVLTNCSLSTTFNPSSYATPSLPPPPASQIVYCEQGFTNSNWQQVTINFTANGNYDMIMIYPEQDPNNIGSEGVTLFSYPELIDITNFNAGSTPNPTPGNCLVTIGPRSTICGVRNSVFTWYGPHGQTINVTPPNLQIQLDASNPQNVGTWTLKMEIPGSIITNNTCSQQGPLSSSVTIPSGCLSIVWPKIYEAYESNGFKIDNSGNIYSEMELANGGNNINHNGVPPNNFGDQYIHYNKVSGYTNWISTDWSVGLTLTSGIVNFFNSPSNNIYRIGNTGVQVNGPSGAPLNEKLFVEENGGFVSQIGYNLNSYSPSGTQISSIPIASISGYGLDTYGYPAIYNPATNNVYISHTYYSGTLGYLYRIGIYHFDPVTYTLSSLNNPANNQIHGPIAQVNSAEKIFVYNPFNLTLEEYDPQTYQYTPLNINNFSNSSLELVGRSNQLVEDKILIKNTALNYFYCINTAGASYTSTKISYTPPSTTSQFYNYYVVDGSDVFISGEYQGTGFSIGNQSLPLLGSGSAFLTKFNLQSDFNTPSYQNFITENKIPSKKDQLNTTSSLSEQIRIFPNPAKDQVTIISSKNLISYVELSDSYGNVVYQKKFTERYNISFPVNIFAAGVYFCNIQTKNGVVTKKIVITK